MISNFFSVAIVNFNSGKYLESAILSVINQTCKDFELIVVDGGSTDNSIEILEKYKSYFSWWVSEPDKGQSDAFNKAYTYAVGEYYLWLNADDLLFPNALEKVKLFIQKNPVNKWYAANTVFIDQNQRILKCFYGISYSNHVLKKGNIEVGGPSTFFHRSLYNECGPFEISYNYTMDGDLWEKFVNAGYSFKRIPEFCWVFRVHEESKTSHVFLGNISQKVIQEIKRRKEKNKIKTDKIITLYQYVKKTFLCYPLSFYYTLKYKNQYLELILFRKKSH